MAKSVTIQFGGTPGVFNVDNNATVGEVLRSPAVREDAVLSQIGDNVIALDSKGVEISLETTVTDGMVVYVETKKSTKG